LLNALVGRRIAKTAGTPGKTRALNVFLIPGLGAGGWGPGNDARAPRPQPLAPLYFLDLPGYGYARAGRTQRASFRRLLHHALRRERLRGVVWLLDIRREPSADDWTMHELLVAQETGVLAALTKADKLTRGQQVARMAALREGLQLPEDQVIVTSVKTGEGIVALKEAIGAVIHKAEA
ncbi:MAG: GTP-binding protein, partial [Gemmatimonadales bacterium]